MTGAARGRQVFGRPIQHFTDCAGDHQFVGFQSLRFFYGNHSKSSAGSSLASVASSLRAVALSIHRHLGRWLGVHSLAGTAIVAVRIQRPVDPREQISRACIRHRPIQTHINKRKCDHNLSSGCFHARIQEHGQLRPVSLKRLSRRGRTRQQRPSHSSGRDPCRNP